jgi:hypothetical protein
MLRQKQFPSRPPQLAALFHLNEQAERLRKEAQGTAPGVARDKLIRRARQAEIASRLQNWLLSPGLKAPQ